jgi:predicted DNA-binding transcriptional regulator AlpA
MEEGQPIRPRLLDREQAAGYVGLSPNAFDREVRAGTFPAPFPLTKIRRRLWDVRALDAALDRAMGIVAKTDDRESRKAAWRQRKDRAQAAG